MGINAQPDAGLLPADALANIRVGISVSDSSDLPRLGLLETHFRLALGEIARCVLVSGGHLAYGGHLDPDGYTVFLVQELHRYSRRDRPLLICLPWQEHRRFSVDEIKVQQDALGLYGKMVFLNPQGNEIDPSKDRPTDPSPENNGDVRRESLTAMRGYMAKNTQARILLGGRREGFQGDMPGLLEEALIALHAGQPLYLAGGFGGVTADINEALGVDDRAWLPKTPDVPPADERLSKALEKLGDLKKRENWAGLQNGLTEEENRQLAASHRPSEIAALISLGLGRRFQAAQA
jgi:hypothetical protein